MSVRFVNNTGLAAGASGKLSEELKREFLLRSRCGTDVPAGPSRVVLHGICVWRHRTTRSASPARVFFILVLAAD